MFCFFFFNDTATTEIYTLSLHDALPISVRRDAPGAHQRPPRVGADRDVGDAAVNRGDVLGGEQDHGGRSEEDTSELQSRLHLVCRLLLEKKKKHSSQAAKKRRVITVVYG